MTKELKESLKAIARLGVLLVISWFLTETLKQANLIPEYTSLKVWVFTYSIPVRSLGVFGLTFLGTAVDKYLHVLGKSVGNESLTKGLTRF